MQTLKIQYDSGLYGYCGHCGEPEIILFSIKKLKCLIGLHEWVKAQDYGEGWNQQNRVRSMKNHLAWKPPPENWYKLNLYK